MARLSTSLVLGAVWPMYWPTRSSRVTETRCPLRTKLSRCRICAMRSATVVLPVPGLPLKHMCRLGDWLASPRLRRSLSITSRAAMSRMRALTGLRPTRSVSSSCSTASTCEPANTSATERAPAAGSVPDMAGRPAPAPAADGAGVLPGMAYKGELMHAILCSPWGNWLAQLPQ